ncbi:glycosyltransferase [Agromyces sp. NPDC055520]
MIRQISWLIDGGWTVDAIGLGPSPHPSVRRMFEMPPAAPGAAFTTALGLLRTPADRFSAFAQKTVPADLLDVGAPYDLVVVNEIDLLPWFVGHRDRLVTPSGRLHLDLHEFHEWQPRGRVEQLAAPRLRRYHSWLLDAIAAPAIDSRSTVAPGIARLYSERNGVPAPVVIRNSPRFVAQEPSPVDASSIELIHHGFADPRRGLELMIDAMREIDSRFRLTLMLTGSPEYRERLANHAVPLGERVRFIDPVPIDQVTSALNPFDLEIILFPPTSKNLRFTLPNKLFEAVQGRLGLVIGPSVDMAPVLEEFGNGVVADGWTASDLAAAVNRLTPEAITALKRGSDVAARELSADHEGARFLALIDPDHDSDHSGE